MRIELKEQQLVLGLYFVSFLCLLFSVMENAIAIGILIRIRYIYILCAGFLILKDGILIWNKRLFVILGTLVIHTILYCLIFTNPVISNHTASLFQNLMIVYMFVLVTVIYIYKNSCYLEFLVLTSIALSIMILWTALMNLNDFVNPIYFINVFSRYERYRSDFGLKDVNFCGNYVLYTIIMIIITVREWEQRIRKLTMWQKLLAGGILLIATNMLLSTASRSALLSLVIFILCCLIQKYWNKIQSRIQIIAPVLVLIGIIILALFMMSGKLSQIWSESNREGNFSINYPIFLEHGNLINGMGYADNSGYLGKIYGYETTAQDVYFLYIWFSTGCLGALIIFSQMIYMLYLLIKYRKAPEGKWALSIYVFMLFYCIWQVNYMNARYHTGVVHMVILFYFVLKIHEEKDTIWIKLQR